MTRGAFIVFEGLDRCGKTTQINMLLSALRSKNIPCVEYTFPGIYYKISLLIIRS